MVDRETPRPERFHAGRMTMLQLVQSLTREGLSERDIVALVRHLVESGQVIPSGNFRDTPLEKPSDEPTEADRRFERASNVRESPVMTTPRGISGS